VSEEGVQTMNVRCPSCRTVFRVDPAKVPEAGVRARCAVCAATIDVRRDGAAAPRPAVAEPARVPAAAVVAPPAPAPVSPPTPEPPPAAAARAPRLSQPFVAPRGTAPPAPTPAAAAPPVARPSAPVFRPTPGQPVTVPPPRPAAAPPAAAAASAPPAAPPKPAAAPTEATAVRPINPFLQKDPKQKARRLARALVSDMIVYQPAKRQRALAAGTLKTEFDEEIQKSWEEYVEQVGEALATSTPYWREALNEILAGGQQLF